MFGKECGIERWSLVILMEKVLVSSIPLKPTTMAVPLLTWWFPGFGAMIAIAHVANFERLDQGLGSPPNFGTSHTTALRFPFFPHPNFHLKPIKCVATFLRLLSVLHHLSTYFSFNLFIYSFCFWASSSCFVFSFYCTLHFSA